MKINSLELLVWRRCETEGTNEKQNRPADKNAKVRAELRSTLDIGIDYLGALAGKITCKL